MRLQSKDFLSPNILNDAGNPIVRSVNMLHKHLKSIVYAVKENNRLIPSDPDTRVLINELKSANIGYLVDGSQNLLIREVVVSMLGVFENQSVNRVGSGRVAELIQNLEDSISDYFEVKQSPRVSVSDLDLSWMVVVDSVSILAHILHEVFSDYARHVFKDLNRFNSFKIKINKIERAIKEAGRLENIVSALTLDRLVELSRGDRELYELLSRDLYNTIGSCLDSFAHSGHEMRKAMGRWKIERERGVRRNELCDDFTAYFANGGTLDVFIDRSILPKSLSKTPVGEVKAYADFNALQDSPVLIRYVQNHLSDIAENDAVKKERARENSERVKLDVVEGEGEVQVAELPYFKALFYLFQTFAQMPELNELSAVKAHAMLDTEVGVEFWLTEVVVYYTSGRGQYMSNNDAGNFSVAQKYAHFKGLRLEYVEKQDPLFDGNMKVHDVLIKRV